MGNLIFWGAVFVLGLIAEIMTLQLVTIWFAVGAVGAFIAALMNLSFQWQLAIFVVVSVFLLLITRPLLAAIRVKHVTPTNADGTVGKTAVILEEVNESLGTGRARLNGVDWMAVSETGAILPPDAIVKVVRVEGAKLIVTPANEAS
ncbi:MAG: NfeD family protein [Oscillospiraceae bacterium]|nr:NfeD family protein [Oscillospiraceae bacterium]